MRSVAIIGLGNFGANFAKGLRDSGLDLIALDADEDAVNRVAEFVPRAVVADATDRKTMEELGLGSVDIAVVSLGGRMDGSILVVLHLKALGVKEIFVKAISDDHAEILRLIGATRVIHPEREVAEQLARAITHPNVVKYLKLGGDYAVLEMKTPSGFVGKSLKELHLRREHEVSVIAVSPGGDPGMLQAPAVDEPLRAGSMIVLIGDDLHLEAFQSRFRA